MGAAIARNDTFIGGVDLIWSRVGAGFPFAHPESPFYAVGAKVKADLDHRHGFGGPIGPPNL